MSTAAEVLSRVDPAWEKVAASEPFFSVIASPKYLVSHLTAASLEEFFDTGDELVDHLLRTIEIRLDPAFAPASILEYGCGVGRLAIPLAKRSASVVAVDRSPVMLEFARRQARDHAADHVAFKTPAELFAATPRFDLVVCYSVLQRIQQDEGLELLRMLLRVVAPGGVAVFNLPYASRMRPLLKASRWARSHIPGANAIGNVVRGKSVTQPIFTDHLYDLNSLLLLLKRSDVEASYLTLASQESFEEALVFVRVCEQSTDGRSTHGPVLDDPEHRMGPADGHERIDTRELIARSSIEDLNQRAEAYFAELADWDHHLSKPFSSEDEASRLLMDVSVMLAGLNASSGVKVLEFGAGSGWLSRYLTQLGCHVILLDVSETALQMARETYRRLPVIGDRPEPTFLRFDGYHIDLPDQSVDRIVSFHAFHHVPNPTTVLEEFGRILKPGGIAAFVEPGPRHSRSASAQFEMRTYGVVESDVNVHEVWRTAQNSGFAALRLAVYNGRPFHLSLEEYEEFLAGGPVGSRWMTSSRDFCRHVRTFFLIKEGSEASDSRTPRGLSCDIDANAVTLSEGERFLIPVTVTNTGTSTWLPSDEPLGGVKIGAHLYDQSGTLIAFSICRQGLTQSDQCVSPGETIAATLEVPPQRAGHYLIELDCVAEHVTWFAQVSRRQDLISVEIR